jgi:DNA-binding response OmpR family regulator
MPPRKACILVVDNDVRMLRLMRRILEMEGYRVLEAGTGEAALEFLDWQEPDLVLLEVTLPGLDGYEVCRRIREFSTMPIIMVSAKGSDDEKLAGFDAGADDYVTKPFSTRELMARVKAVLRRAAVAAGEAGRPVFAAGDLVVDFGGHRVTVAEAEVNLTATEYRLLSCLAANAGRVLTPDQLLSKVWGEGCIGQAHLLQATMSRLREKLCDNPKEPKYIATRHGIGYMMIKG